jgi:hypothetical protein
MKKGTKKQQNEIKSAARIIAANEGKNKEAFCHHWHVCDNLGCEKHWGCKTSECDRPAFIGYITENVVEFCNKECYESCQKAYMP